jgi:hypothetical protein
LYVPQDVFPHRMRGSGCANAIFRPALIASPAGSGSSPFGIGCSAAITHPAATVAVPSIIAFVFMIVILHLERRRLAEYDRDKRGCVNYGTRRQSLAGTVVPSKVNGRVPWFTTTRVPSE